MGVVGVRSKREDGTAWGRPGGSRAEFTPEGLLDWQRCLNFPVSRKGKPVEGSTQGKRIPGTFYLDRWAALWRAGCELELSELVTKLRASEDRLAIPPKVKSAGEGGVLLCHLCLLHLFLGGGECGPVVREESFHHSSPKEIHESAESGVRMGP